MENIKWYKVIMTMLVSFFLTGCGGDLPDTYQKGSDYQYMEKQSFNAYHQEGEKVHYFLHGHYIYYMDKEGSQLLPLCGKADCLHDRETDTEKLQNCNAYTKTEASDTGIAFCNGYLYYVENHISDVPALYRLSADGMKKEQVYEWEDNIGIEQWIIHRDVFYYAEHKYLAGKSETEERYALKSLALSENVKKPKVVHEVDKNLTVFTVAHPQAYGNYLYFQVHAQKKTEEEVTDDNYLKYQYMKTFIYDMKKDEVSELTLPDLGKDEVIQGVTFWQGKIVFGPYNPHIEFLEPVSQYIADLDGSNAEIFMEDIGQGLMFLSDGEYLYLSNLNMVCRGYDKGDANYKIYDKNLKLVDTVKLPFKAPYGDVGIGTPEMMYILYEKAEPNGEETEEEEEREWGIFYWDKSKIGSYDGSAFEITDIKYEG